MVAFGDMLIYVLTFFGIYTSVYFLLIMFESRNNLKRGLTNTYPTVSIIVPCFNEKDTVIKTLKSLLNLDYDKDKLEIVVVDDGSTDNTYEITKKFIETLNNRNIKIYRKENGGKYTALNYALERINSEYFGALDADSFVDKYALRRIIPFFYSKKVASVTPSMKVYKPKTFLQRIQEIEFMMGIFLRKVFAELGSIHVTPGPFSIYRTEFVKSTGYYRKAHHTEDIEMALRIQQKNLIIENSVDAYIYTMGLDSFNSLLKQRVRWYSGFIKNVYDYKDLFSHKHGNLGLFILPSSFISVLFVIVSLFYVLIKKLLDLLKYYKDLSSINFDIFNLDWFHLDVFFLNTNSIAAISIISLLIGLLILYLSKKVSGEKKSIALSYIFYMIVYWFLFGFWWILSILRLANKKEVKWGHKSNKL
ncbi:MAG: glycosyltransferase family 2 protein [Candidatus Woesearchaeota archaeon]